MTLPVEDALTRLPQVDDTTESAELHHAKISPLSVSPLFFCDMQSTRITKQWLIRIRPQADIIATRVLVGLPLPRISVPENLADIAASGVRLARAYGPPID